MIRLDPMQKALIDFAAQQDEAAKSTWIRERILKLARGWQLSPPMTKPAIGDKV